MDSSAVDEALRNVAPDLVVDALCTVTAERGDESELARLVLERLRPARGRDIALKRLQQTTEVNRDGWWDVLRACVLPADVDHLLAALSAGVPAARPLIAGGLLRLLQSGSLTDESASRVVLCLVATGDMDIREALVAALGEEAVAQVSP